MKLLRRKAMIVGANGLLGQNLLNAFVPDYDVLAIGRKEKMPVEMPGVEYARCDITQRKEVIELIKNYIPNIIVNAAAYTNVDGSETEREQCWKVNATAVEYLAQAAKYVGVRLVHVSTDYVFDGAAGPYTEADRPNPLGYYGKSKLAGENALKSSGANYAIARTMVLYGAGVKVRLNFVTWLIQRLQASQPVRIVTDQAGNPTLASELAVALRKLAESGRNGIYHISGSEVIDRYSFALKIAQAFDLDQKLITPITTAELEQAAARPARSSFDISKAVNEIGITMSDAMGGLQKFRGELMEYQAQAA